MIIGPDFVWLHFPKCAGTFTEHLIRKYFQDDSTLQFDAIDPLNVIWHQSIRQREKTAGINLQGRDIISNFRRLPSWIISRIRYEERRTGKKVPRDLLVQGRFFDINGTEASADKTLLKFSERGVDKWIRVENLRNDFVDVFSEYLDLPSKMTESDFNVLMNTSGDSINVDLFFTAIEMELLYKSNPVWAAREEMLYGELLQGY
jgi:hypothetical protein